MKLPMLVAGLCIASASGAQVHIQSSDPSAFTPDPPSRSADIPRMPAAPPQTYLSRGPENLTNATVIALVQAGLGSETVIAKINASTGSYDTSTDALIQLKRAGVPDPVIAAMLRRSQSPVVANAAAAAPSTPPRAGQPSEFTVGTTTIANVTARLGKPNSVYMMADGTEITSYVSMKTHVKGASFVPIVGLFAGGAKGHMALRTFTFGPDGLLKSYMSNDTNTDCNVGLVSAGCH